MQDSLILRSIGVFVGSIMIGSGILEVSNILMINGGCQSPEIGGSGFYSGCNISLLYGGIAAVIIIGIILVVFSIKPEIIRTFPSRIET